MSEPAKNQPAIDPIYLADTTYFFHPEDSLEAAIHQEYVEWKYPGSEAMVVSELLVPRLTERNHVIVLSRPTMLKNHATRVYRDPVTLQKLSDVVPVEELFKTVKESPVIAVGKYIVGASKRTIGRFDANRFFDDIAQYMFGGRLRGQPSENTVRFLIG